VLRPDMASMIEPSAFMASSDEGSGLTRFRTTLHPIPLPPVQPPLMSERLRKSMDEVKCFALLFVQAL